jgi:hypothetical protein
MGKALDIVKVTFRDFNEDRRPQLVSISAGLCRKCTPLAVWGFSEQRDEVVVW